MKIKEILHAKKQKAQEDLDNALEYVNHFIRDCLPDIIRANTPKSFEAFKERIVSGRSHWYCEKYETKRSFSPKTFLKRYAEATITVWFNEENCGFYTAQTRQYLAAVKLLMGCPGFNRVHDSLEGSSYDVVVTKDIALKSVFTNNAATRIGPRLKAIFYEEAVKCAKMDDFVLKQDKNGLIRVRYYY